MTVVKIIELRATPSTVVALDELLRTAQVRFESEPGTVLWRSMPGADAVSRTLVEVFTDEDALRRHDESRAVAQLLSDLDEVLWEEPRVTIRLGAALIQN